MLGWLAIKDLWFERLMSLCFVTAQMAVIAPLLLLFSLRYGILTNLEQQLLDDPTRLEIKMLQSYNLDEDFFTQLDQDETVAFIMPLTRALSVSVDVKAKGGAKQGIEVIPTGPRDPIVIASGLENPQINQVLVSAKLAQELKLQTAQELRLVISRIKDGVKQNAQVKFEIAGILKNQYAPRSQIYVDLDVLTAIEDYKDGFEPQLFSDGSKLNLQRKFYAKARIYAKDLDSVEPLVNRLAQYKLSSSLSSIEQIKAIGAVLNFVFYTIAATSIIGGAIACAGLSLSNLRRKRTTLATLQLMGLSFTRLQALVTLENLIMALVAYLGSMGLVAIGQRIFNHYFSAPLGQDSVVAILTAQHWSMGALLALGASLIISLLSLRLGFKQYHLAQALREVV